MKCPSFAWIYPARVVFEKQDHPDRNLRQEIRAFFVEDLTIKK
jgi:hypothetical protein